MPPDKRLRIAEETMEIYAPLAGRMGMQDMREELEDLAFRHLNPEAYGTITGACAICSAQKRASWSRRSSATLTAMLDVEGHQGEVKGRAEEALVGLPQDGAQGASPSSSCPTFSASASIVDTVDDCYRALGVVHTTWPMVPGRFKDYISTPKQNDYRSIHTTIVGPCRQRVELQIRTEEMNKIAEYGIAAHALYKDGGNRHVAPRQARANAYAWLRRTIEHLAEGDNPEDFLEHTKLELFQDQVFCFTPKGRLIALPRGATPIDFAYAVHTDVGDTCVGAKINGRIMPLMTELKNGDEVEIIRSEAQVPPAAWESIVVTGKARAAIRRATEPPSASNIPGSAARSSSAPSSAPARRSRTTS